MYVTVLVLCSTAVFFLFVWCCSGTNKWWWYLHDGHTFWPDWAMANCVSIRNLEQGGLVGVDLRAECRFVWKDLALLSALMLPYCWPFARVFNNPQKWTRCRWSPWCPVTMLLHDTSQTHGKWSSKILLMEVKPGSMFHRRAGPFTAP